MGFTLRGIVFGFRFAATRVTGLGLPGRFPNSPIVIAGFTSQPAWPDSHTY